MKKTKLLMPILGVGAVAATVAPMVAITGCNKDKGEVAEFVFPTNIKTPDQTAIQVDITWSKYKEGYTLEWSSDGGTFTTKDSQKTFKMIVASSSMKQKTSNLKIDVNPQIGGAFEVGDTIKGELTFHLIVHDDAGKEEPREWDQTFKDISITRIEKPHLNNN